MDQEIAELKRKLAESEARAAEEQRLREEEQLKSKQTEARATEEQRRREEEQLKSKQAEARATEEQRLREEEQLKSKQAETRATEEQRLREEEQRRREAAEADAEQAQPKTLVGYLRACHDFCLAINIITDKTLTTKGETTKPEGRPFPKRIVPWADFPIQQEQVWEKLSISPNFHSQHVFPSSHQLEYVQKYLDPINSELGLRHYARDTVENPVRTLIEEVYKDEKLREQLQLGGTVMFESHTNLGQAPSETLTGEMEGMSITDPNTEGGVGELEEAGARAGGKRVAKGKAKKTGTAKRSKQRAGRRRAGIADQFCIYELLDGKRMPVVSIEYKAPHKFPLAEIIAGLDGEIRPAEEIINQEGNDFKFLSKSLVAAVITQLFSDMIGKGVQRGYVFVGDAIIFLHIPDDPTMVYYHLSIPSMDFQEDDVNRFHRTSVAQIFAFVLGALTAAPPGQAWHDKADGLDTWAVEYIDILKKIPETELKKRHESLSYRATRWKGFARSPIRTRSSGVLVACNPSRDDPTHDDDEHDDDEGDDNDTPPTPTPQRITRQHGSRGKAGTVNKGGAKGGISKTGARSKDVKEVTSRPSIEERQYCTHQCLLGLAHGGSMDPHCPNFPNHEGEHISRAKFLRLIRLQLATDRGRDADCTPLYIKGSRGALFKIRLSSHGYTLLAKGMEEDDRDHLVQECKVYQHVRSIQGIHVPVCMGMVDLKLPYYYDFCIYATMLFLSWGGRSIYEYLNRETADQISDKAGVALQALHKLKVKHNDAEPRNMLWDEQHDRLMLVDFERAEIRVRQPLSTITANRKRKRQGKTGAVVQDVGFDCEIQTARREISRCII